MHTDQDETFHLHFPQQFQIKSFKGIKCKQGWATAWNNRSYLQLLLDLISAGFFVILNTRPGVLIQVHEVNLT